jgi:small GTP-binding protein
MSDELKIVVVGDTGVGKTSSLLTFCDDEYPGDHIPTTCHDFWAKVEFNSKTIELRLWDTSGSDKYNDLRTLSYTDTNVFLIQFDINDKKSLKNIKTNWIPEINKYCPGTPYIIVGNKMDLREDNEEDKKIVKYDKGLKFAKENGAAEYCECSSKNKKGLSVVYETAVKIHYEGNKNLKKKKFGFQIKNLF